MSETLIKQGAEPVGNTPREFAAFIKAESAKYANVIKATGVISE
jgi:tripartite-type tricarboxylate transporter receptor subunit TctC